MSYGQGDPAFDETQQLALEQLVKAVRELNEKTAVARGDAQGLQALATEVAALAAKIDTDPQQRPLKMFRMPTESQLDSLLPYSFINGRFNPVAPLFNIRNEGDRVVGIGTLGAVYEGPPHSVHGGWIAAAYDQMLALANLVQDRGGFTASITVNYRQRTPLYEEIRFEAWHERAEGKKIWAKGKCTINGQLLSEAEGLFIGHNGTD